MIHCLVEPVLVPVGQAFSHKPSIGLPRRADLPMERSQDRRGIHLHRTGSAHIGRMTAPGVCPGAHGRTNPGGVEMEVSYQLQEIGLSIAQDGLEAPLKDVAGFVMATIVVLTVGKLERLHRARQGVASCLQ